MHYTARCRVRRFVSKVSFKEIDRVESRYLLHHTLGVSLKENVDEPIVDAGVVVKPLGILLDAVDITAKAEHVLAEVLERIINVTVDVALVRLARVREERGVDVETDDAAP